MDLFSVVLQEIEKCILQVSDLFATINDELEMCLIRINNEITHQFNVTIDIERNKLDITKFKIISKLNLIHMLHSQLKSIMVINGVFDLVSCNTKRIEHGKTFTFKPQLG